MANPRRFWPAIGEKFGPSPPEALRAWALRPAILRIATFFSAQSSKAPAGRRQRKELRAPSSSSHRPRWRRLAHSAGVQFSCLPTAAAKVQPLSAQCRLVEAGGQPTLSPDGPDCSWKTAIEDRAPLRRPPRRAQLRCCSAGYGAVSEKEPRPTVSGRAPRRFILFRQVRNSESLLRRGARCRSALEPGCVYPNKGRAP